MALTPKMKDALTAMLALDEHRNYPHEWTPNQIGMRMGQPKGRMTRSGSSPTHARVPSEGSGIASVLRGLQTRGLIRWTSRPDGMTGIAYGLTDEGTKVARALAGRCPECRQPGVFHNGAGGPGSCTLTDNDVVQRNHKIIEEAS